MKNILYKTKSLIPKKIFKALQPFYHFIFAWISACVYKFPSNDLIVIGVTGTTGKTTSVYLMAKMLNEAGIKTGYTSTAMFNDGKKEWLNDKKMTMMGRFFTQKIIRTMLKNNCRVAIIETTSEGVRQFRHRFINYDILVFTGLYPEHIESHGSFENYKKAKGNLFKHLKRCESKYVDEEKKVKKIENKIEKTDLNKIKKTIIVNGDDENASYFLDFWADEKIVYTKLEQKLQDHYRIIQYGDINTSETGISFKVDNEKINLKLLGEFNVSNTMNAISVGFSLGMPIELIKDNLKNISGVPGRLEKIDENQNFCVIVDYAFEPGAVKELYETIKNIPHNKVIHVLGSAGGGRDIVRRPELGRLAGLSADFVIVSNEDPYDEDPEIIIDQVALGAERAGKKENENLFKILDRREAIKKAISLAHEKDLVLITGKGSEQAICVAHGEKVKWDDREVLRELLKIKK
jgi:UDP-N-acetylmuramoyl-L-alanyl-D-glutamate--2,6-diaminopimelate ligase